MQNINESLKTTPDIKKDSIERIYKEASVILSDIALKRLSELERFYEHLTSNRQKRFIDQKNGLSQESRRDWMIKSFERAVKYNPVHEHHQFGKMEIIRFYYTRCR